MSRGAVRIFNGSFANVQGVDAVQRMLASIPEKLAGPVQTAIDESAAEIAEQAKAIAPVAPEFEGSAGELRDSVHSQRNGRALSATVLADAEDAKGHQYAGHVEYGHKTPEGGHVAAKPFFWPSYRVKKKAIRTRVQRAIREGVKAAT